MMDDIRTKRFHGYNGVSPHPAFGVVTPVAPPSPSGQSRVVGSLLEGLDRDRVVVATEDADAVRKGFLGFPYHRLPVGPLARRLLGIACRRLGAGSHDLMVHALGWWIARLLHRHGCQAVIGCTASPYDLPAAWLAARRLGIPFIAYLFDDPVLQWTDPTLRALAQRWAERWMPDAAALIAPNEVLARDVAQAFGVQARLLRNPAPPGAFAAPAAADRRHGRPLRIVYTGSIYHAHFDAFHNLLAALPQLPFPAELHVYTSQDRQWLADNGVRGQVVWHDHIDDQAVFAVQRDADVLFLPLAFDCAIPDVIRSSAPGKLGEYLASGVPVLAHVPAGSFVAEFFTQKDCGTLVDVSDVAVLRDALRRMVEEPAETARLVARAKEIAAREFNPEAIRATFVDILHQAVAAPSRR